MHGRIERQYLTNYLHRLDENMPAIKVSAVPSAEEHLQNIAASSEIKIVLFQIKWPDYQMWLIQMWNEIYVKIEFINSNKQLRAVKPPTLQKLLADVCPTQFGRDKIDCSHAKCRRCCFYFCDNFHFPTNKKEEKTIAAVIYYKKLNILSALINIYLNFKISTSSSQTIPFQFLYFLSRPNCVGQTSAKSFRSVGSLWVSTFSSILPISSREIGRDHEYLRP